jgi:phosphoribosylformylglycinamidine cyclo-ligase
MNRSVAAKTLEGTADHQVPHHGDTTLGYRDSGVDIDAGEAVVSDIKGLAQRTYSDRVIGGLGHFGGFYRIGPAGPEATLVASIDGVGTKLKVAALADRHESIGADIVNHCLNDILACGAHPLFFLDYYGTGRLDPSVATDVIGGIARACEDAGIALLGGETAEMPGMYQHGDYDLVGAIVGVVDSSAIVDGSDVCEGDLLVGLPSDGFHTNGYSLIRTALSLNSDEASRQRLNAPAPFDPSMSLAEALLRPHRSYRHPVRLLLQAGVVRGMAHITGGGLPGNVARIVPDGLVAEIDTRLWSVPAMFEYVAEVGHVASGECYRVFNMGVGFVVIVSAGDAERALELVGDARVIGRVGTRSGAAPVVLRGLESGG